LVDRTRNFKSNASRFKQKKYDKNAPQARFLMKQNAPQARFIKQNAPQARILDAVLMDGDDCFYYHSWRNNVVIAFGTLSSFLT